MDPDRSRREREPEHATFGPDFPTVESFTPRTHQHVWTGASVYQEDTRLQLQLLLDDYRRFLETFRKRGWLSLERMQPLLKVKLRVVDERPEPRESLPAVPLPKGP